MTTTSPARRPRLLATLAAAGVAVVLAAGCSAGAGDDSVHAGGGAVVADDQHAAVQAAVKALAAAELRLSNDFASVVGADVFGTYLRSVAGAATVPTGLRRGGADCARLAAAIRAANAAVIRAVSSAQATLNGRVNAVRGSIAKIAADKQAVVRAAATLKQALAADPTAWRLIGTDQVSSTLDAVAEWQTSLADAITSAQSKAASFDDIAVTLADRAANVGARCQDAATRDATRPRSSGGGFESSGAGNVPPTSSPSTSPTSGTTPTPSPTSTSPVPSPTTTTPAPEPTTTTPAPEPTTTTPAPEPTTTTPAPEPTTTTPAPEPTTTTPAPEPTTTTPAPEPSETTTDPTPEPTVTLPTLPIVR